MPRRPPSFPAHFPLACLPFSFADSYHRRVIERPRKGAVDGLALNGVTREAKDPEHDNRQHGDNRKGDPVRCCCIFLQLIDLRGEVCRHQTHGQEQYRGLG